MSIYLSVPWPLLSISLLSTLMTHVFNTVSHSLSLSFSQADYIRFSLSSTFSLLQLSHTRTFTCTHTHSLFLLTHTHTQSLTESICLSLLLLQLTVPPFIMSASQTTYLTVPVSAFNNATLFQSVWQLNDKWALSKSRLPPRLPSHHMGPCQKTFRNQTKYDI